MLLSREGIMSVNRLTKEEIRHLANSDFKLNDWSEDGWLEDGDGFVAEWMYGDVP